MTGAPDRPGHGPADPDGYLVEQAPEGYRWTCRADGRTAGPFPTRGDAVTSADADRDGGSQDPDAQDPDAQDPDAQDPRGR